MRHREEVTSIVATLSSFAKLSRLPGTPQLLRKVRDSHDERCVLRRYPQEQSASTAYYLTNALHGKFSRGLLVIKKNIPYEKGILKGILIPSYLQKYPNILLALRGAARNPDGSDVLIVRPPLHT